MKKKLNLGAVTSTHSIKVQLCSNIIFVATTKVIMEGKYEVYRSRTEDMPCS